MVSANNLSIELPTSADILVVGNGMVGAKFCQDLVNLNLNKDKKVVVLGGEPVPAYNRIKLSSYVDHEDATQLELLPRSWYLENDISLFTGEWVDQLNTKKKFIKTRGGHQIYYDKVVLAMGSKAFAPPIEGIDLPNVFLYRSIKDIADISEAARSLEKIKHATIIGGGLLGLEAAQAFQKLEIKATVIQRANFLMSAQLNEPAGNLLQKKVEEQGIEVLPKKNTKTITTTKDGLELTFQDGKTLETGLVVIAAGISPISDIAEDAEMHCGIRGGVVVDGQLNTSEPDVFAIGECARFRGEIYGLAAPGYQMAEYVANKLAGKKQDPFTKPCLLYTSPSPRDA